MGAILVGQASVSAAANGGLESLVLWLLAAFAWRASTWRAPKQHRSRDASLSSLGWGSGLKIYSQSCSRASGRLRAPAFGPLSSGAPSPSSTSWPTRRPRDLTLCA